MNFPVSYSQRRKWLLATTVIFGALAAPAGAYVLRDTDPRIEEMIAALPDTKASATVKPINVEDVKDLVVAKAAAHGVPTDLARAVVQVESDYDPATTGGVGEVGLMQIKYETARILGYGGTLWELYDPETNIEWGMRYLAGARRLADGDLCGTAMRYNGGHGLKRMSRATTIYCNKVKRVLGLPPDPVPVADVRDDGKRKDAAEKKQDERNDKTAGKRDKATIKLAAAERKTETPAKNAKADMKISAKADTKANAKTADTARQNGTTQGTKDTRTAQANRDKPADRKVAAADARAAAASAKHLKIADAKQETTAKKIKLAELADKKIAPAVAAKPQKMAEAKQGASTKNTRSAEPIDKKITAAAAAKPQKMAEAKQGASTKNIRSAEPIDKKTAVNATVKQAKLAEAKQQTAAKTSKQIAPADKKITVAAAAKQPKAVETKQAIAAKHTKPVEPAAKAATAAAAQAPPAPMKNAVRKHDKKLDHSAVTHVGRTQPVQPDLVQAGGAIAAPAESRIRIADHRVSE